MTSLIIIADWTSPLAGTYWQLGVSAILEGEPEHRDHYLNAGEKS